MGEIILSFNPTSDVRVVDGRNHEIFVTNNFVEGEG